jgi:hypothetical protein
MSQVIKITDHGASGSQLMESVLLKGDISKLTPEERTSYYFRVCESLGLNPLTKPFEFITLNGKLVMYAVRNCTDQLRTIYGVSVEDLTESERDGVFIVTAKVRNKDGRTDIAKGAVNIANLKGEALANALMKTETKAKRRATLSICGLGFLDETEVEDIPIAAKQPSQPAPPVKTIEHHGPEKINEQQLEELRSKIFEIAGAQALHLESRLLRYLSPDKSQPLKLLADIPAEDFKDAMTAAEGQRKNYAK